MAIIDAHAHIFSSVAGSVGSGPVTGLEYGRARFAGDELQLMPPAGPETTFPPATLLANMDWAGVERAVLLQGSFYGERNQEVIAACEAHPDRFVGAAFWDPWAGEPRETFERVFSQPRLSILKLELSHDTGLHGLHPGFRLTDPALDWLWEELERRDLNLTLDLGPVGGPSYQTEAVYRIATQHPSLRIAVCHLGFPTVAMESDKGLRDQWQAQIELGRLANVWFDLSALPHRAEQTYPYPRMRDWLNYALETIGHEKLMWGTDAPGVTSAGTYPQLLTAYQELLSTLSPHEQARIYGENALTVYW